MSTLPWPRSDSERLPDEAVCRDVAAALSGGAVLVYPTETVYGIGCALSAGDEGVERVRACKRSPPGRPFLLLASSLASAFDLWSEATPAALALAEQHWPGPLTLVGLAREGLPTSLLGSAGGRPTVSVRVPGDPRLLSLLAALGEPLLSTSANLAGAAPPVTFDDVDLDGLSPDLALNGGPCAGGSPSTLISFAEDPPRLLRAGPIPWPQPAG